VSGLSPGNVFSYSSCAGAPTTYDYVGVSLVFPADGGEDAITLSDGVDLRNLSCSA
jgi:hypothetical protein